MIMKPVLIFFLALAFLPFSKVCANEEITLPDNLKFNIGEELEYSLKWSFFKVGKGYLRVYPVVEVDGKQCYHLKLSVETNSFADAFYKVRSEFNSYVSVDDNRVVRYRIEQHEGDTHRDATVHFDWENLTATYHRDGEDPKEPVEISENSWDPLSVVYRFRQILSAEPGIMSLPATDGKKALEIDVKILGEETAKTQLGEFRSIVVRPDTKEMKGVFEKSKKSRIKMWYSHDENRFPLLIKSKVIVGSFIAELKKVRMKTFDTQ